MLCPECKEDSIIFDRDLSYLPNSVDILFLCEECKTKFYARVKRDDLIKIDDD